MEMIRRKKGIGYAVLWIVIYCAVNGTVRGTFGIESPWLTLALGLIAVCLTVMIRRNRLEARCGLDAWPADGKRFLYFIPMWFLATGNLWSGAEASFSGTALICSVLSMALVGYIEEVIFRGLLFRALLDSNREKTAVIISAVSFGAGHILNLLSGQATPDTVIQILFAVAWGFLFTMVFYKSGSLLPGIIAHSIIDVFSLFSVDTALTTWGQMVITIVISLGYCMYLKRLESCLRD